MTVKEILDQVKLQYPASSTAWTDAQMVAFLNIEQDNIYHELQVEALYDFVSEDGTRRYALPSDMQIDNIRHVLYCNSDSLTVATGTVTVTAGSKDVVGVGTTFTDALEGSIIVVDGQVRTVDAYTSTTEISVTENFTTAAAGVAWYTYAAPGEDVSFSEYPFVEYNDILKRNVDSGWYKYSDGTTDYIGFYPEPSKSGHCIRVVYLPKPADLSSSVLTAEPDLYYRWHNLLVYALIREIAMSGSNPDTNIANNYGAQYNAVMDLAKNNRFQRERPGYRGTKDVMRSWGRSRRARGWRKKQYDPFGGVY